MARTANPKTGTKTAKIPVGKPGKKPAKPYHHGDLRHALLDEAVRTIQAEGVEHLTLRTVGARLGVSRSALYRHFADKQSLLAAVGKDGFRKLREATVVAWEENGRGRAGFEAMGKAYVRFATSHPSHYRVMFGGFIESAAKDADFIAVANAAFQALVDALVDQQKSGDIRRDDPILMACFVWSLVHGTAMLVIDGQLCGVAQQAALEQYCVERIYAAIRLETSQAEPPHGATR